MGSLHLAYIISKIYIKSKDFIHPDAGAAEGKITPSATLICGSFDMNYTMQLRSLFGVK